MRQPTVLIVSNGYGEDAVGNLLARHLRNKVEVTAYPLVGLGHGYIEVPLLEPRRDLPSGGFGLRGSWKTFLNDLRQGFLGLWGEQRVTLRGQRGRHTAVVAIGDVFCLWVSSHAGRPVVFVATAKSEHNEPHRWIERRLIRRVASVVFTRDQVTADALAVHGIPARYVGNPLMDTIENGEPLDDAGGLHTVTLLPGSRADASRNLALLLRLCAEVRGVVPARFICAPAPTMDVHAVEAAAQDAGWHLVEGRLKSGAAEVMISRSFGASARAADVVVGLAGTASEQAAGLGKPVVAFPGPGTQYTPRFMALQKRLLGDALVVCAGWRGAADVVRRLLQDEAERSRRGAAGRARMGSPGAISRIAEELIREA